MSVRRSSRIRNHAVATPVNTISNYGGVKRRLTFDDNNTHAKKLARVEITQVKPCQMPVEAEISTPKTRPTAIVTPMAAILTPMPSDARGIVTPTKTPTTYSSRPMSMAIGDTTPKSCRRRLFHDGVAVETPKTDLYYSTFSAKRTEPTTASSRSAATTSTLAQRHPEKGNYARLSKMVKDTADCKLPTKFERIYNDFETLDRVMSMPIYNNKRITFEKVAALIQRKTKREFSKKSLARIVGMYPSAYNVSWDEDREAKTMKMHAAKKYSMFLIPNLKGDLESYWTPPSPTKAPIETRVLGSPVKLISMSPRKNIGDFIPFSPRKTPVKATPQLRECRLDYSDRLEPWRMQCRKHILKYKLFMLVSQEHDKFLEKIKADKNAIEFGAFHEKFNLDSVADVVPATLPMPPQQKAITEFMTPVKAPVTPTKNGAILPKMIDVTPVKATDKTDFVLPNSVNTTLAALKSPQKPTHSASGVPLSPRKFAGDTPKLSLYERIMAKQRAREERLAPVRQAALKRLNCLQRLRDNIFYTIWTLFCSNKQNTSTLKLELLKYRILKVDATLTGEDCVEIVDVLCEIAPRFFDVYSAGVHSTRYVRMSVTDLRADHETIKQHILADIERVNASMK